MSSDTKREVTANDVIREAVDAFKTLQNAPIYPGGGSLPLNDPGFIAELTRLNDRFCPTGYLTLGMATLIAFGARCEHLTNEREKEEKGDKEEKEEQCGVVVPSESLKLQMILPTSIATDFDTNHLDPWIACILSSNDEEARAVRIIPPLITVRNDHLLSGSAQFTIRQFRRDLSSANISAFALEGTGRILPIPAYYWNSESAFQVLWCDTSARFWNDEREFEGQVIIHRRDLVRHLNVWAGGIFCHIRELENERPARERCRHWLSEMMAQSPDVQPRSKDKLWGEAQTLFADLSRRQFDIAWRLALAEHPEALSWSKGGRRPST